MNEKKFPNVNYIGNKQKLSRWIYENLPIKHGTVIDLFGGGGSVSYELKKMGFKVITNDALYSSYVLSKSLIENKSVTLNKKIIENARNIVIEKCDYEKIEWLSNNLYFDYEVAELAKFIKLSETMTGYERFILQALIRRAMIRKLPYSRMNVGWDNIVKLRDEEYSYNKYGRRRAYHNKTFEFHILDNIDEYNNAIFDNDKDNVAFQKDSMELLREIDYVDLIYLDPPYPNTMNNYQSFYGAYEKIFNKQIEYTDWSKTDSFLENIVSTLEIVKNKTQYVMLSINTKVKPDYIAIIEIMRNYGEINLISKKHNYQLSGSKTKNENVELLILLEIKRQGNYYVQTNDKF